MEEMAMIKAARTAKRVWRKRLAHNIFSKPEQHWKPKLEAELYDIKQDKVQDDNCICVIFMPLQPSENDYRPQPLLQTSGTVYNVNLLCS